jgi:hypothetical protein
VAAGYVLLLAAYTVLMILVRPDRGKARTAGLLLVGATLALALCAGNWFGAGAAASGGTYADEWGVIQRLAGLRIIRPSALLGGEPSPWALAFALSPLLLLLAKREGWALWLLASVAAVLATAFNPFFVELTMRKAWLPPWGVWRLALQVYPFQLVLGGLGALALRRWVAAGRSLWGWSPRTSLGVLAVATALSFAPSAVPLAKPLAAYTRQAARTLSGQTPRFGAGITAELGGTLADLPPGSVVLTDANTSYFVAALADQHVVAIPYGHSSPWIKDDDQRRRDNAAVLDPATSPEQVTAILDRYGVQYVLLSAPATPLGQHSLSAETFDVLRGRFDADSTRFQRVVIPSARPGQRFALYRYAPTHGTY